MNYKQTTDIELWQGCQQDDVRAFNELFHRYFQKLYKQAARYIINTDSVKELILDLMQELWEKRHQKIIAGEMAPYLNRCMRNRIVSYRRKVIPYTASIDTLTENSLKASELADDSLLEADTKKLYQSVLNSMPPQRRKVFQLSREQNMTYAEIAREMNLSVNTVERYMVTALQHFRNGIKEQVPAAQYSLYLLFLAKIFPLVS